TVARTPAGPGPTAPPAGTDRHLHRSFRPVGAGPRGPRPRHLVGGGVGLRARRLPAPAVAPMRLLRLQGVLPRVGRRSFAHPTPRRRVGARGGGDVRMTSA